MKLNLHKILATFLIVVSFTSVSFSQKKVKLMKTYEKLEIEMFPKAETGFQQVYFQLPIKKNEGEYRIEIFVGKEIDTDSCNSYFMTGEINEILLDGWQYLYYKVNSNQNVASTLMGCMDNKTTKKIVFMPSKTISYNSKLPVVLYLPVGMKAKYKIWTVGNEYIDIVPKKQ